MRLLDSNLVGMKIVANIDDYIRQFSGDTRKKLVQMREIIKKAAPGAVEAIKYGMPTFVLGKNLVHFAAMKNHIGFYPSPSAVEAFKKELSMYKTSKGAIQFPLNGSIPILLVKRIVKFRVKENLAAAK